MSVGFTKKQCRSEGDCKSRIYTCGAISGENSDMNVQATGIAAVVETTFKSTMSSD